MSTKSTEPNVRALRAIHDHLLSRIPAEHSAARQIAAEVRRLAELGETLAHLHATVDPTLTPAAQFKRVAEHAAKLGKETTATINRISEIARRGLADIEARIGAKTNLKIDVFGVEVRDMYRRMTPTERTALLNELVEDPSRGAELAALISPAVPRSATGMTEEYRSKWEQAHRARHAAAELLENQTLNETLEGGLTACSTCGKIVDAYSNPVRLAEIAKAESAAAAVAEAFNRAAAAGA